jgi:ABC-type multidrug transport system permease subunit
MKQILAVARKEFWLWARRPGAWIVVFLFPLLFTWILQSVFGSAGVPTVSIYAVNEDESQESLLVMEALRAADNLAIEELDTRKEADQRVGAGERLAALVVPEGYGSQLLSAQGADIEIIIDPARAEQANIVIGLANAALAPLMVDAEVGREVETGVSQLMETVEQNGLELGLDSALPQGDAGEDSLFDDPTGDDAGLDDPAGDDNTVFDDPFGDFQDDQGSGEETPVAEETPVGEETLPGKETGGQDDLEILRTFFTAAVKGVVSSQVQEALENPQVQVDAQPYEAVENVHRPSLLDYLSPGYSLMFVYFLIPSLALTVLEERQTGALRRLLSAPLGRSQILLGKLLPYFLIAVAQFLFVLAAGRVLFGVSLGGSPVALGIVIVASALAMAGLGILIAAFARTEGQADGLATIIVLAMAVVSGAMFPNIAIPGLQSLTPHYWSMQGFLNVILYGQGVPGVLGPAGILLTMAAVFFTIGAVRFRFE